MHTGDVDFLQCIGLDGGVRRSDNGRTLLGGSPLRLLRVSETGARLIDDLAVGTPVPASPGGAALVKRLLATGMAHPQPWDSTGSDAPDAAPTLGEIAVVVPVRNDARSAAAVVAAVASVSDTTGPTANRRVAEVVVVDDGSQEPVGAIEHATVIRHNRSSGPAAARNTGWQSCTSSFVAFVDADVTLSDDVLPTLLQHFADPDVVAVAPRVRSAPGPAALDRYEVHRGPLDMGPRQAAVAPRTRVSYVPSAMVLVRRSTLEALNGFDASLRTGEDVDFIWRAVAAGGVVRYEPRAEVHHRNRATWRELLRQRRGYGAAAAPLASRHNEAVTPLEINVWSLVAWILAATGGTRGVAAGTAVAAATTAQLVPKLRGRVDNPVQEAARLGGYGHLHAGGWIAQAVTRSWLPLAVGAAVASPRARRALALAVMGPAATSWIRSRPRLDPVRWILARTVDDAAYCAGVWQGCIDEGDAAALRPKLTNIKGL